MQTLLLAACRLAGLLLLVSTAGRVAAVPIEPTRDDEVVEVLPAAAGDRAQERRSRRALAERPNDPALAVAVAQRYLDQAHALGDPRFAGLAMAAIAFWTDPASTPDAVLLTRATLQQYLHEFDASVQSLRTLLSRPSAQARPQPWLTLATVRRVQGRYADSDEACRGVAREGARMHGLACLAENDALRGDVAGARRTLRALAAEPGLPAPTRAWLLTTLAELEQRSLRPTEADAAYRAVLELGPDPYATVAYADFLIEQERPRRALALLAAEPRTDNVLLRLAIAGVRAGAASAPRDVAEMRERIALSNQRPEARSLHGREQAMFALQVDGDASLALALARADVARQREPLDLLVFARAAKASGDAAALEEARRLRDAVRLHDRRLDALL